MFMLVWLFFLLGQLCHTAFQVETIVRAPNNVAYSRLQILKDRWIAFLIRTISSTMFFWIFLAGELATILGAFNVETPSWLKIVSVVIQSSAGPPIAWFIGLAIDSLLAFIPFLKSYIPDVEGLPPTTTITTTTEIKDKKAETHTEVTTEAPPPKEKDH